MGLLLLMTVRINWLYVYMYVYKHVVAVLLRHYHYYYYWKYGAMFVMVALSYSQSTVEYLPMQFLVLMSQLTAFPARHDHLLSTMLYDPLLMYTKCACSF